MVYKFKTKQYLRSLESGKIYLIVKRFYSKDRNEYYYTIYNVLDKRYKSLPVVDVHRRYIKDKIAKLLYGA